MNQNNLMFVIVVITGGLLGLMLFILAGRFLLHFLKSPVQTRFPITKQLKTVHNDFRFHIPVPSEVSNNIKPQSEIAAVPLLSDEGVMLARQERLNYARDPKSIKGIY